MVDHFYTQFGTGAVGAEMIGMHRVLGEASPSSLGLTYGPNFCCETKENGQNRLSGNPAAMECWRASLEAFKGSKGLLRNDTTRTWVA
jgi:hypothetical protein